MGEALRQTLCATADAEAGCLYLARVMHRRRIAPHYRFVYRLFYLLVDVDRVDVLARRLRLFSHNRFNLLSLRDADYGSGASGSLRARAEAVLAESGVDGGGGRIRLLTLPRLLGFAFNPLSLWYCERGDGRLAAVIAEVRNTFGERHSYVLDLTGAQADEAVADKEKCFHVSPFLERSGRYRFVLAPPGERLRLVIHESRDGTPVLDATLAGERRAARDATILRLVLGMPAMTLKVVAAIHWQALKLWLRGAAVVRKPAPLNPNVS